MSVQNSSAFCLKMSSLFQLLVEVCVLNECKEQQINKTKIGANALLKYLHENVFHNFKEMNE